MVGSTLVPIAVDPGSCYLAAVAILRGGFEDYGSPRRNRRWVSPPPEVSDRPESALIAFCSEAETSATLENRGARRVNLVGPRGVARGRCATVTRVLGLSYPRSSAFLGVLLAALGGLVSACGGPAAPHGTVPGGPAALRVTGDRLDGRTWLAGASARASAAGAGPLAPV